MKSKTILMICPFSSPNIGGVEAHLDKLIGKLLGMGCHVHLISYQPLTTKARAPAYEKRENLEIYRVSWFGYNLFHKLEPYFLAQFLYLFPGLFFKSLLFYLARHKEIDVIHVHGLTGALIGKIITKIHPKRIVVSTHAVYNFGDRMFLSVLVRNILKNFDKILAVGDASRKELIALGFPPERIEVHPNWIDLGKFRPLDKESCRKDLQLDGNQFIVFYIGRLIELKGVRVLLEVAKEIGKDVTFLIAGDGPMDAEIKEAARGASHIVYRGKIDSAQLVSYYNACDLFVLPSQYNEGFATVILEALACGAPVIVTNRGCVPSYVDATVGDLIDPIRDALKERILYYRSNPMMLKQKAASCRAYAEKHFSEDNLKIILRSYDE